MMFLSAGWLVALGLEELRRFKVPVRATGSALAGVGLVGSFPHHQLPRRRQPHVHGVFHRPGLPASGVRAAIVAPACGTRLAGYERNVTALAGRVEVLLRHAHGHRYDTAPTQAMSARSR